MKINPNHITLNESPQAGIFDDLTPSIDRSDMSYRAIGNFGDEAQAWFENHVQDTGETIDDLSPAEKSRIQLIFAPTAHVTQYAHEAIRGLRDADYVLFEGLGSTEAQRLHNDVITNLAVRGYAIDTRPLSLTWMYMQLLGSNRDWRSQVVNGICRTRTSPPIFRTIDMAEDSPQFIPEIHSAEGLIIFDTDHSLFSRSLKKLRAHVWEELPVAAQHIKDRDDEMFNDISKIAAQAVRQSEGNEKIVFGVGLGAVHSMIARNFEKKGVQVQHRWSGPAARLNNDVFGGDSAYYSFGLSNAILRKAAYCPEEIEQADVDCLLSYEYVTNALLCVDPSIAMRSALDIDTSHMVDMIASEAVYRMLPSERQEFLKKITSHRASVINPFFRGFRLAKARKEIAENTLIYLEGFAGPISSIAKDVLTELKD